jgi:GT2 family glycosyltransferase
MRNEQIEKGGVVVLIRDLFLRGLSRFRSKFEVADFFNVQYYLDCYPDVAASNINPLFHFNEFGWKEGRNPSATFNTVYYAIKYMSGNLCENPLSAFINRNESNVQVFPRSASEWADIQKSFAREGFNERFYYNNYQHCLRSMSPIDHYFEIGWRMGLNPSEHFSTRDYINRHRHILNSDLNPLVHHIITPRMFNDGGLSTGVSGSEVIPKEELLQLLDANFDVNYYLDQNPDVKSSGSNPLVHYLNYGWREGRNPTPGFWPDFYKSQVKEFATEDLEPFTHYLRFGKNLGLKPNPIGVEPWPIPKAPTDEAWAELEPLDNNFASTVVVIPVYQGYDDTLATIFSVLSNKQETPFELLVIFDDGPNIFLRDKLRSLAERRLFHYLENEKNLGFVGTANRGLMAAVDRDVVLLNADTLVFGNWMDRLLAHARNNPNAGTITPMSNNATLTSYPEPFKNNRIALECTFGQLDHYASICNSGLSTQIPTGVGFCFFIRGSIIRKVGVFDEVFGRGYGEENDFCMRVLKSGYDNLLAHDVIVYHSGEISMGEFKDQEMDSGQLNLMRKHPDYPRRIRQYMNADPGLLGRVRLDLYRLSKSLNKNAAILISIKATGGLETHLNYLKERLVQLGIQVVVLYVGGSSRSGVCFEIKSENTDVYTPSLNELSLLSHGRLLAEFLDWVEPKFLHLHSVASLSWEATKTLFSILGQRNEPVFVTLHDYDSLCHRHHLVDTEGKYCDPFEIKKCRNCIANDPEAIDRVDPTERMRLYSDFLPRATSVFVPSVDTKIRLASFFPNVVFEVREHEEALPRAYIKKQNQLGTIIVVAIGAIGPHKGSDILYSLALDAKLRELNLQYVIVGYSAISHEMEKVGVIETGRYNNIKECMAILEEIAPDLCIFPSIWPETYCYTLSIALSCGIPSVVFDLGAQADRVRHIGAGLVLEKEISVNPQKINDTILEYSRKVKNDSFIADFKSYDQFLETYYCLYI